MLVIRNHSGFIGFDHVPTDIITSEYSKNNSLFLKYVKRRIFPSKYSTDSHNQKASILNSIKKHVYIKIMSNKTFILQSLLYKHFYECIYFEILTQTRSAGKSHSHKCVSFCSFSSHLLHI